MLAGLDRGDLVDHVHPFGDARKNRIAEVASLMVKKVIVLQVYEKLRRGAVDVVRPRHRQATARVLQAVVRLILDRRPVLLLAHVLGKAAALDHEARDDAVKDRAIEEFVADVLKEIFHGHGCFLLKKFDREISQRRFEADHDGSCVDE